MKILRGNDVLIEWTINHKLDSSITEEDFSKAELKVYLAIALKKIPAQYSVNGNVIAITIPGNVQESGWLSIEAIWSKNERKNWSRAMEKDVIFFVEDQQSVDYRTEKEDLKVTVVPVCSQLAGNVGYDGITPHIGANGHWFIGDIDTEVMADMGSRINVVSELPATGIPGEFYALFE